MVVADLFRSGFVMLATWFACLGVGDPCVGVCGFGSDVFEFFVGVARVLSLVDRVCSRVCVL
ncbi:hypothetical protein M758_12G051900 [Ceratodon purpureus]|nr:hypothetical protein M758_12G051900 [Ceratodon purpureus]